MTAAQRRSAIYDQLTAAQTPISATALARQFSVTRQVVVGDIALLRAEGHSITATPRGYMIPAETGLRRTIACHHSGEDTQKELFAMVDCGCTVVDVIVEHPVYGQLVGQLQVSTRYEVNQFLALAAQDSVHALSELTDGIHIHTLRCPDEAAFQRVWEALDAEGFLVKNEES